VNLLICEFADGWLLIAAKLQNVGKKKQRSKKVRRTDMII